MATATKRKLTKREKGFADDLLEGKQKRQAVKDNYDLGSKGGSQTLEKLNDTADVIGQETFNKPRVQAYLEENAEGASTRIVEMSKTATVEAVKLNANKDILDRAGYKPAERNINMNVNIKTIDATNPKVLKLIEELRNANEQKDKN